MIRAVQGGPVFFLPPGASMTRLRRPIAVLLLVCALIAFVPPSPSRAIEPVTAITITALASSAAVIYARNAPGINHMVGRAGSWAMSQGRGLVTTLGTFASAGAGKLVGFTRQVMAKTGDLWKMIKNTPSNPPASAPTLPVLRRM